MHKLSHKDFSCIISIIDSIEKIEKYTADCKNADEFYDHQQSFDASMMNFVVIGEMAERLSEEFRKLTGDVINWNKIKAFRNIIAHNYFGIDAEEVWQIIQSSLLGLKNEMKRFLD